MEVVTEKKAALELPAVMHRVHSFVQQVIECYLMPVHACCSGHLECGNGPVRADFPCSCTGGVGDGGKHEVRGQLLGPSWHLQRPSDRAVHGRGEYLV